MLEHSHPTADLLLFLLMVNLVKHSDRTHNSYGSYDNGDSSYVGYVLGGNLQYRYQVKLISATILNDKKWFSYNIKMKKIVERENL